jgi:predicted CXXCH cytochrome family protein
MLLAAVPGVALANYSIHGGYAMDTDACAGCHRAHTAVSPIEWSYTDPDTSVTATGSALLLSYAPSTDDFCYTCHGVAVLGANTNVEYGVYEGTDPNAVNTDGSALNGGGFSATMFSNTHNPIADGWYAYGGGTTGLHADDPNDPSGLTLGASGGIYVDVSCTVCHDVHGSSNYRLLKDQVNGIAVGGYLPDGTPTPFVISAETGYPVDGWLLGEAGAAQMDLYEPSYTEPLYAKAPGEDPAKGMSGWCASCHTQYVVQTSPYAANDGYFYDSDGDGADFDLNGAPDFEGDADLLVTRHRHPVNVELTNYGGPRPLTIATNPLPLAHDVVPANDSATQDETDWLDCMTCHYAHGSNAQMTGFADVAMDTLYVTPWGTEEPELVPDSGNNGVPPANNNALLRGDNRYVCEACHNK